MTVPVKWGAQIWLDYSLTWASHFGEILATPDGGFLYAAGKPIDGNTSIFTTEHYNSLGDSRPEGEVNYQFSGVVADILDVAFIQDGSLSFAWLYPSRYGSFSLTLIDQENDQLITLQNVPNHNAYVSNPKIIPQSDGGILLLWYYGQDYSTGSKAESIRGQYFDSNENLEGAELIVHSGVTFMSYDAVCLDDASNAIVWIFEDESNTETLQAQISSAAGVRTEFIIDTSDQNENLGSPKVISLSDNRIAVFWTSHSTEPGEGEIRSRGQIFRSSGEKVGEVMTLPSTEIVENAFQLETGEFLITWLSQPYGFGTELRAQLFSSDGNTVGQDFLIYQYNGSSSQAATSVATLADGRFVISWDGWEYGADESLTRVQFAQIFDPRQDAVEMVGTSDNDSQAGTQFDDSLSGLGGDDVLLGVAGDDFLAGGTGNDTLDGGAGTDWMRGGIGHDQYIVDDVSDRVFELMNQGVDTVFASVSFSLSKHVENLALTGADAVGGVGNALANIMTGNDAANLLEGLEGADTLSGAGGDDTLDGGAGVDSLNGGEGNDSYVLDRAADLVTEEVDAGIDTVITSISYALGRNLERLELIGSANSNGTGNELNNALVGNDGRNKLIGREGDDTLSGGSGADRLDGGSGIDQMDGGLGNDVYIVDNLGDVVFEFAGAGKDRVESSVSFTLAENIETLRLMGSGHLNGTGNDSNNLLLGNTGRNLLSGGRGADTLDGGAGSDGLSGGTGSDVFVFKAGYGADRVTDFADNVDTLRLDGDLWGGGLTIEQLLNFHAAVVGENLVLEFGDDVLTLIGLTNVSALLDDIVIV